MTRWLRLCIAAAVLAVVASTAGIAQEPPPPEPSGNRAGGQFAQMQEKYKYTFQLMTMVRHIGEIDRDPKYALTAAQAKKVLAVLTPLRSKPKLTQDQAKDALKSLKTVFTVTQLNAMAKIKTRRPGGGQWGGRPGGQGGDRAGRPHFDPDAMKDFNPFYSKVTKGDEFSAQRAKRWDDFFKTLQDRSMGVKPKAAPKSAPKGKPAGRK